MNWTKDIKCKIVAVCPNVDTYGDTFFDNYPLPNVGEYETVEREYWYPFKVGGKDGYSVLPCTKGVLPIDKNGNPSTMFLYYVRLEQLEIITETPSSRGP